MSIFLSSPTTFACLGEPRPNVSRRVKRPKMYGYRTEPTAQRPPITSSSPMPRWFRPTPGLRSNGRIRPRSRALVYHAGPAHAALAGPFPRFLFFGSTLLVFVAASNNSLLIQVGSETSRVLTTATSSWPSPQIQYRPGGVQLRHVKIRATIGSGQTVRGEWECWGPRSRPHHAILQTLLRLWDTCTLRAHAHRASLPRAQRTTIRHHGQPSAVLKPPGE